MPRSRTTARVSYYYLFMFNYLNLLHNGLERQNTNPLLLLFLDRCWRLPVQLYLRRRTTVSCTASLGPGVQWTSGRRSRRLHHAATLRPSVSYRSCSQAHPLADWSGVRPVRRTSWHRLRPVGALTRPSAPLDSETAPQLLLIDN